MKLWKRLVIASVVSMLGMIGAVAAEDDTGPATAPTVGLYRFTVPDELREVYINAGARNLSESMEREPDTYAMSVSHVQDNPAESYVLEIYKDREALESHRKSDHYQDYINTVGAKLVNRRVYDVQPLILLEKSDALSLIRDGKSVATCTDMTVSADDADTMQQLLLNLLEPSIRDEEGYLAAYVVRDRNAVNTWHIFEFYADDTARTAHVSAPGYRFFTA